MSLRALSLIALLTMIAVLAAVRPVAADTILKKDGQELVGKIVKEEEKRVLIEVRTGKMLAKLWVNRKDIAKIERGVTPDEEVQSRLEKLEPYDLDGHLALAEWAKSKKLYEKERYIRSTLPTIVIAHRRHTNPRTWCRTCGADGVVACKPCEGSGGVHIACARCEGAGIFQCKSCKGREGGVRCRRCAGEGQYERFDPLEGKKVKKQCPDCRGKGERDCPTCKGKGHSVCPSCDGATGQSEPCESCNGKPDLVCPICAGGGLQQTPVTDEQLAQEAAAAKRKAAEEAKEETVKAGPPKKEPEKKPEPVIKKNPFDDD